MNKMRLAGLCKFWRALARINTILSSPITAIMRPQSTHVLFLEHYIRVVATCAILPYFVTLLYLQHVATCGIL